MVELVEASLVCRDSDGESPLLLLPMVTGFALAYVPPECCDEGDLEPDGFSPNMTALTPLPDLFPAVGDESVCGEDAPELVLTETILGKARTIWVAGMGSAVASFLYTSDMTDDLARDGVMECVVYCVSRLPDLKDEESENQELSRKSEGRKKRASLAPDRGLFGVDACEFFCAYAAGMGGTGARLLWPEPLRFVTPGM